MRHLKIIDNDEALDEALDWLDELMEDQPAPGTPAFDTLQLLSKLIGDYESTRFPADAVSPIEMIRFRMDQMGLTNKDLVPYLGSAAKVSEVLSGKRGLSVSMVKALAPTLKIDPSLLLEIDSPTSKRNEVDFDISLFPFTEMFNLGYFGECGLPLREAKKRAKALIENLLHNIPKRPSTAPAMLRAKPRVGESEKQINEHALLCWQARVLQKSKQIKTQTFDETLLDHDWIKTLVSLSCFDDGHHLAVEFLAKYGILVIIEPHLKQTYLDGAVFRPTNGNPVIAMTLRHKGLDSFWFTLLHELAHLKLHTNECSQWIIDDLDSPSLSDIETEADNFAAEALMPTEIFDFSSPMTSDHVRELATKLCVAPEIVAGRARHVQQNFKLFGRLFRRKVEFHLN